MLELLTVKFSKVTMEVFAKSEIHTLLPRQYLANHAAVVDEMAQRLDELEASIKAGNIESNTAEGEI